MGPHPVTQEVSEKSCTLAAGSPRDPLHKAQHAKHYTQTHSVSPAANLIFNTNSNSGIKMTWGSLTLRW